ncbi:YibE/F family protein [uncultured Secundilactobacillus sp.]|uniref:YibE/F family protein n=1 Tax=uncultured Secundilactobacillus sp. TaxID=2813935 RepID=UPI0025859E5E|nr:YibE/F family protein [uncultured Secundilactobacillus sp.]
MKTKRLRWPGWLTVLIIAVGGLIVLGVAHDDGLYKNPIMKITAVKTISSDKLTDQYQNADRAVTQQLTGVITNGQYQGKRVSVTNTYNVSQANSQQYRRSQRVFLTVHSTNHKFVATISDLKRDTSMAMTVWLVLSLLVGLMRFGGLMAFTSVLANGALFWVAVRWNAHTQGALVLTIFGGLAILFTAMTLSIVIGLNKQMLMTFLTTVVGTALAVLIAVVVFQLTNRKGVYFESMQYVTQLPLPLFLAEAMLGSLGAVMDEATDIIASLMALKEERPDISARQIFRSGREIGGEIMGPLVNVLFFIFVADTLPMAILFLKNANSWGYTFNMTMSLGVIQSLISGIGIVLTVPIACWITSSLMGGLPRWIQFRR